MTADWMRRLGLKFPGQSSTCALDPSRCLQVPHHQTHQKVVVSMPNLSSSSQWMVDDGWPPEREERAERREEKEILSRMTCMWRWMMIVSTAVTLHYSTYWSMLLMIEFENVSNSSTRITQPNPLLHVTTLGRVSGEDEGESESKVKGAKAQRRKAPPDRPRYCSRCMKS